jgi:hypothetical protein
MRRVKTCAFSFKAVQGRSTQTYVRKLFLSGKRHPITTAQFFSLIQANTLPGDWLLFSISTHPGSVLYFITSKT